MPDDPPPPRVAFVHDWLLGMRGGERVLEALLGMFPGGEIHTLFHDPSAVSDAINRRVIHPSVLNRLPGSRRYHRALLPLMPSAVARLNVAPGTGLVVSTSHCVAHGVRVPAEAAHLVYCFSPMRYLYDQSEGYAAGGSEMSGRALSAIAGPLRRWDRRAGSRPGVTRIAISEFVARRMRAAWGVTAEVIHPPVRTDFFTPGTAASPGGAEAETGEARDAFLVVSALTAYKRVDAVIDAAARLGRPLVIAGSGPLEGALRRRARAASNIRFLGRVSDQRLLGLYRSCRALIFPGVEDFGIVPLEAMACGRPVLARRAGGLLETHREGVTGAFFDADEPGSPADSLAGSLADAWAEFDPGAYDPAAIRAHAEGFGEARFVAEFGRAAAGITG